MKKIILSTLAASAITCGVLSADVTVKSKAATLHLTLWQCGQTCPCDARYLLTAEVK